MQKSVERIQSILNVRWQSNHDLMYCDEHKSHWISAIANQVPINLIWLTTGKIGLYGAQLGQRSDGREPLITRNFRCQLLKRGSALSGVFSGSAELSSLSGLQRVLNLDKNKIRADITEYTFPEVYINFHILVASDWQRLHAVLCS